VTAAADGVAPAGPGVGAVPTDVGCGVDARPDGGAVDAEAQPPQRIAAQVMARRSFMAGKCATAPVTGG